MRVADGGFQKCISDDSKYVIRDYPYFVAVWDGLAASSVAG